MLDNEDQWSTWLTTSKPSSDKRSKKVDLRDETEIKKKMPELKTRLNEVKKTSRNPRKLENGSSWSNAKAVPGEISVKTKQMLLLSGYKPTLPRCADPSSVSYLRFFTKPRKKTIIISFDIVLFLASNIIKNYFSFGIAIS